ncbi:MAG: carboxypeptidase regulatory-like domain-containing protein, partial [Ardenticatenaceae bacterium]
VRSIFPDQRDDPLDDPAPADATGVWIDLHSYSELVLWPWGFTGQPAPNGTALQTLGRKFAYFNDYTPQQSIELYPTDGTTDDFGYGDLGIGSFVFELGTAFFQQCSTFENTILPDNLPALLYAAKASRTPYLTPAGPDALNVALSSTTVAPGDPVTLDATLDDTRFNNSNGSEPVQPIAAAAYYVDVPPWSITPPPQPFTMTPADGAFNSPVEGATATINTSGLSTGRHTIFVRGRDNAGNWGAVSAAFLFVIDPDVSPVIEGYVREAGTNAPLAATVSVNNGLFQTTTDPATGYYQLQLPSGTYDLTASAPDHASQTVEEIVAQDFQTIQQDFSLSPICAAFADDVEGGTNGWTAQSPWAITTEASHSPTHSWTDSPGGDYSNGRNVALSSPVLDLTGFESITLNYWQICDTEAGYDFCHVEISADGGATWSEVAAYDGAASQWEEISIPVAALDNQPDARVRFRFTSDGSVRRDGWHVDDIRLLGGGPACGGQAPTVRSAAIFLRARENASGYVIFGLVAVRDGNNVPVPGATVDVTWTLPDNSTQQRSATANDSGLAFFATFNGTGTYTLTVDNITAAGYTFDPDGSVLTRSITVP